LRLHDKPSRKDTLWDRIGAKFSLFATLNRDDTLREGLKWGKGIGAKFSPLATLNRDDGVVKGWHHPLAVPLHNKLVQKVLV